MEFHPFPSSASNGTASDSKPLAASARNRHLSWIPHPGVTHPENQPLGLASARRPSGAAAAAERVDPNREQNDRSRPKHLCVGLKSEAIEEVIDGAEDQYPD